MLNGQSHSRFASNFVALASLALISIGCGTPAAPMPSSDSLYLEAQQLYSKGQNDQAIEKLDASIDAGPTSWNYFLRARIHVQQGNDQAALADCEEGLKLDPADIKLIWLKGELGKPQAARFQGALKNPPIEKR
jgi:tetratricopeptide (TPR) repeat protein